MRGFGYVLLALIAYGSIYPFQFATGAGARLGGLVDIWHQIPSDVIENILAFLPIGVAFRLTSERRVRRLDFVIAGLVAILLQLVQLWLPTRNPALTDAFWNTVGLGAGAWATGLLRWVGDRPAAFSPVGLALLSLFVLHILIALFVWSGHGGGFEAYRLKTEWRASNWLTPVLPWLAGALAMAPLLRPRMKQAARLAVTALLVTIIWQGLTPITFVHIPFQWVPIKGLISSFTWNLALTIVWKIFAYAALTRLLMLAAAPPRPTLVFVVALVLLIEIAQSRLGSGTPDITEPLLALLCAWGILQEASVHAMRVGGGRREGLRRYR